MSDSTQPAPENLLGEVEWIRALARRLASEHATAEDLAQEACAAALAAPPRDPTRLRPWIASVMRNLAREWTRNAGRRDARERETARPEAEDGVDRVVERAQVHREMVEAVCALEEPFRTAVLLRFFENLAPRAIAARTGVPVATVHSRIGRGLAKLRERLGESHGPRWLSALLPLLEPTTPPLILQIGVLALNVKLLVGALVALLFGTIAAVTLFDRAATDAAPRAAAQAPALATKTPDESAQALPAGGKGARTALVDPLAPAAVPPASAPSSVLTSQRTIQGRVFDADGLAISGIDIAIGSSGGEIVARSAQGGTFQFSTAAEHGELFAAGSERMSVRPGLFGQATKQQPVIIFAPSLVCAGRVFDEQGVPLDGAQISFSMPKGFESRFGISLEGTHELGWATRSAQDGRFEFKTLPSVADATLRTTLDGYQALTIAAPRLSERTLDIVLTRPKSALAGSVRGVVLGPNGQAVKEARVALGLTSVQTDRDGEFTIDLQRSVTADVLRAVKVGFQPATMDRPGDATGPRAGWPDHVELRLGPPPLTITGRVVDHEHKALPGARVWLSDPTPFGLVGAMPSSLESLSAGALVPPQAFEVEADLPDDDSGDRFMDNVMRVGPPTAFWNYAITDGDGRFKLEGLAPRSYRLRVMDFDTLAAFTTDPIAAGSQDALVEVPTIEVHEQLAGRVVGDDGLAVEGVRLTLQAEPYWARARVRGGQFEVRLVQPRDSKTTDAEGMFEFERVPRVGVLFSLSSDTIVPLRYDLATDAKDSIEIRVHVRCRFEIALAGDVQRADSFRLLDEEGRICDVLKISPGHMNAFTEGPLVDGRSGVLAVSSAARTLVLLKDDLEVSRHPLALSASRVNRIEL